MKKEIETKKEDKAEGYKEEKKKKKVAKKISKPKPQGKGIVKALGQKGTTGNFKKIETTKGKGAAIAALQNKLASHRGQPIPFKHVAKKTATQKNLDMLKRGMKGYKY